MTSKFDRKKIIEICNEMEKEHGKNLELKYEHHFLSNKFNKLGNLNLSIQGCNYLDKETIQEIRILAISKGGFLNSEYRKIIWKKLFGVKNEHFRGKNLYLLQILRNDEIFIFNEKRESFLGLNSKSNSIKYSQSDIIERDVNRSAFSHFTYFTRSQVGEMSLSYDSIFELVKSNLFNFIKKIFCFNKIKYDYYQGFHDISLYLFLLYIDDPIQGFTILQRIIEFYLKDFLAIGNEDENLTIFETITFIFTEVLKHIDEDLFTYLENGNENNYASLLVSNIVCLFTQKIKNIHTCYRVLDYLLCSHPIAVYILTANVSQLI